MFKTSNVQFAPAVSVTTLESLENPYLRRNLIGCIICATDDCKHVAVGKCDHAVCTLCALRLRVKNKDKNCALCKQDMEIMVVAAVPFSGKVKSFVEFGVESSSDVQPGMEYDHPAGLIFVDCRAHYREIENMRSNSCPIDNCKSRFPTEPLLLKHLKSAHGQSICPLCLEHQSLFISEQRLFTEAQLKTHLKASSTKDKDAGHPLCLFCDQRFYDAQLLYKHMRASHETCPLCPVEHQHRFYSNLTDLDDHLRTEHICCPHCKDSRAVAFTSPSEYSSHMANAHNIRGATLSINFQRKGRKGRYLDLDVTSDDPTRNARIMSRSAPSSTSSIPSNPLFLSSSEFPALSFGAESSASAEPLGSALIPANYRIAGSISGTGTFTRNSNAAALEAASSAAHEAAAERARREQANIRVTPSDFPSLAASVTSLASSFAPRNDPVAPHPLSIFHANQQEARLARQKAEQEELRKKNESERQIQSRNMLLAEALGVGTQPFTASSDPFAVFMRRPIYTQYILDWAKKSRGAAELPRIEKAMTTLVSNPNAQQTSAQLKPMDVGMRAVVHMLARYYGLNSQEYDYEPRRYVSVLRTLESAVPSLLLSTAAQQRPFDFNPLHLRTLQLPVLYFSIINGYFQRLHPGSVSVSLDRGFSVPAPTISLLVNRVRTDLSQRGLWKQFPLSGVKNAGPSGAGLEFYSIDAANAVYYCLRKCEAPLGDNSAGGFNLLDLFDMEPAFDPKEPESDTAQEDHEQWERNFYPQSAELQGVNGSVQNQVPLSAAAFSRPTVLRQVEWSADDDNDNAEALDETLGESGAGMAVEVKQPAGEGGGLVDDDPKYKIFSSESATEYRKLELRPRTLPPTMPPLPPKAVSSISEPAKRPSTAAARASGTRSEKSGVPERANAFTFLSDDASSSDDEPDELDVGIASPSSNGGVVEHGAGTKTADDDAIGEEWERFSEKSQTETWGCLVCTFDNASWEAVACEMCGSECSDSIAAALLNVGTGGEWIPSTTRR